MRRAIFFAFLVVFVVLCLFFLTEALGLAGERPTIIGSGAASDAKADPADQVLVSDEPPPPAGGADDLGDGARLTEAAINARPLPGGWVTNIGQSVLQEGQRLARVLGAGYTYRGGLQQRGAVHHPAGVTLYASALPGSVASARAAAGPVWVDILSPAGVPEQYLLS